MQSLDTSTLPYSSPDARRLSGSLASTKDVAEKQPVATVQRHVFFYHQRINAAFARRVTREFFYKTLIPLSEKDLRLFVDSMTAIFESLAPCLRPVRENPKRILLLEQNSKPDERQICPRQHNQSSTSAKS